MLKRLFSICLICLCCAGANAQEFNYKVSVYHDKISGLDPQVFSDMQKAISDFLNTQKWTKDEFATAEKIDCNVLINLTSNGSPTDASAFGATFSIQATRPVFNATYTSPLINYVDKDVYFHFSQFIPLHFDDNQITGTDALSSNLTAILAYYSYLVLGLDYDSFSPEGGTPYFKKAQNVVNNAPEGNGINGWKAMENTHNRYWITDEILNARFHDVRSYWYTMHRECLDSMYIKPVEARNRALTNLKKLYQVNRENTNSIFIQFFFNAKADELMHILAQAPKTERGPYITELDAMDVPDANKYNTLK